MMLICVMVPLDHHQNIHEQQVSSYHLCVHPQWIELPCLGIPDESMAQVQGPMANHKWKQKEVSLGGRL